MNDKKCSKCKETKLLVAFQKDTSRSDGRQRRCRACRKNENAANRTYKANHTEAIRQMKRAYAHTSAGRASIAKGATKDKENGHRRAYGSVKRAIKKGTIHKPDKCSCCGKGGPVHGHHHDYNPKLHLDVLWLCSICHGKEHRKLAEAI